MTLQKLFVRPMMTAFVLVAATLPTGFAHGASSLRCENAFERGDEGTPQFRNRGSASSSDSPSNFEHALTTLLNARFSVRGRQIEPPSSAFDLIYNLKMLELSDEQLSDQKLYSQALLGLLSSTKRIRYLDDTVLLPNPISVHRYLMVNNLRELLRNGYVHHADLLTAFEIINSTDENRQDFISENDSAGILTRAIRILDHQKKAPSEALLRVAAEFVSRTVEEFNRLVKGNERDKSQAEAMMHEWSLSRSVAIRFRLYLASLGDHEMAHQFEVMNTRLIDAADELEKSRPGLSR